MLDADAEVVAATPTCEVCGRAWSPERNPEEWLGIEVDHAGNRIYAAFCSREHVQEWFSMPLPEPAPRLPPPPLEPGERALILAVGALAVVAAGVFVIGLITIVRTAMTWW